MSTTSLYVELVVIGMQTITWIVLVLDCVDRGIINGLLDSANNVVITVILLGMAYIVGMIFDRLANVVFQKIENKIRIESGMQAKSSLLVDETNKMHDHQSYTRSKYRILRSTSINLPLISICTVLNIYLNHTNKTNLVIAIGIIGILFTAISYWGTMDTIKNFYSKARIIELHNIEVKHQD